MKNKNTQRVMQGAFVLTLASIVAKILSATYRIPLQNLVGNKGFYVYQQVYPIYGIAMTMALTGLPAFISKLVAEQSDDTQKMAVTKQMFYILMGISGIVFLAVFGGAAGIAKAMGDVQLTRIIRVVATMFLCMPLLATGRGFYQGHQDMLPTAKSQVSEQFIRVLMIVIVAFLAATNHWSVYKMGTWAIFASTLGALVAILYFVSFFRRLKDFKNDDNPLTWLELTRRLLSEGGIICLIAAMMVILQLVDAFTVKNGLVKGGIDSNTAMALKGIYDRAQPLVQLGMVLATAFATTFLPDLTRKYLANDHVGYQRAAQMLIRVAVIIALAASVGMIVLMPNLNKLLFDSFEGSAALAVYNISVVLTALIFVYNSILQSLGKIRGIFYAILVGILVKLIFNQIAVQWHGIMAASVVTVASLLAITVILRQQLAKILSLNVWNHEHFLGKLVMANALMAVAVLIVKGVLSLVVNETTRMGSLVVVLVGMIVGGLVFLYSMLEFKLLSDAEWAQIPGGSHILKMKLRK